MKTLILILAALSSAYASAADDIGELIHACHGGTPDQGLQSLEIRKDSEQTLWARADQETFDDHYFTSGWVKISRPEGNLLGVTYFANKKKNFTAEIELGVGTRHSRVLGHLHRGTFEDLKSKRTIQIEPMPCN